MQEDDEAARKARAESLHRQIEKIRRGEKAPGSAKPEETPYPAESPAEFIHRRMRELDTKKK